MVKVGKVCIRVHQTGAYPGFCRMKRLGVFLFPSNSPSQHPNIKFAGTYLCQPNSPPGEWLNDVDDLFIRLGEERH